MSSHETEMRNMIANLVTAQLDGPDPGLLAFLTSQGRLVAQLTLSLPAFQPASEGVAKANPIESAVSDDGGTIAAAELRNSLGHTKIWLTVTKVGGGGDLELSATYVKPGRTVELHDLEYEAPH